MDDLTFLQIDLAAIQACRDRPDHDPLIVPGEQMTDNDYRAGIREVFADDPEFEDWMVDPLLDQVKQHIRERAAVESLCGLAMASVFRAVAA